MANVKGLLYMSPPPVTKEFQKEFKRIVPISPNNRDRMLRYAWGMDRMEYIAGFEVRRYHDTEHLPAKYIGKARWILEGWQSPDIYDKREWMENKHLLGPWPENGVWDFIEIHETPEGEFAPLDQSALDRCRSWSFWRGAGRQKSIDALMEAKINRWKLQDQIARDAARAVANQFGEDIVKALENITNPVSTTAKASSPVNTGGFRKTEGGILVKS